MLRFLPLFEIWSVLQLKSSKRSRSATEDIVALDTKVGRVGAGIARDKTMDDKMMYTPNVTPSVDLLKVPKFFKPKNELVLVAMFVFLQYYQRWQPQKKNLQSNTFPQFLLNTTILVCEKSFCL